MKFQGRDNYVINWPEYPLLRITVCFIFGIYLSDAYNLSLVFSLATSAGILAVYMFWNSFQNQSRIAIRVLSSMVLLLGLTLGLLRGNLQKSSNNSLHYLNHIEKENSIHCRVDSELKKKKRISTFVEILQINGVKSNGKLLVYFGKGEDNLEYQIGDIISIEGNIQRLKDNPNPMSFNYKDHLKYKGVDAHIFLKDGKHKMVSREGSNLINDAAYKLRVWALSIFENRLQDKDQLATASAMVLGYREHLSDELYNSFSETGAVHVLAVSGLHVGIICMIFMVFFDRFKGESNFFKATKLFTLLIAVWTYALVTGGSPAVLRAAVMFSLILTGRLWFKGANIYNILAFSALLLLVYDPYLLFQLSFQFSYLALISIVFFQPHIERLYETKHWITTKIWQLTSVSIAAQVLIFPISIYYFHKFPTYFILSGVAAVFLATFILGCGLLLLCVDKLTLIGDFISGVYSKLLEGFIQIISGIQSLPYNNVDGVYISGRSVVVLYVLIATVMLLISLKPKQYKDVFRKKVRRKRVFVSMLAGCVILLFCNNIIFDYRVKNLQELIVYDVSNSTVIDLFSGDELYSLQSKSVDKQKVEFAGKSYRIFNGNPVERMYRENHQLNEKQFSFHGNDSFLFKNKHLVFADRINLDEGMACTSDVLLVVNNTEMLPYEILKNHTTSLIVLDNSLSYRVKNHWIKECAKWGVKVHDVKKDGVFRI